MKLVDVNVWLATVWAGHEHHPGAKKWFDQEEHDLAFCRVTQMALLRMLTNKAITGSEVLSRRGAWKLFGNLVSDPRLGFLAEPHGLEPLWIAFSKRDDKSHLLWTDDYLAAFAQAANVELVRFDRALAKRYASVRISCLS
jgi:hypothetical protein